MGLVGRLATMQVIVVSTAHSTDPRFSLAIISKASEYIECAMAAALLEDFLVMSNEVQPPLRKRCARQGAEERVNLGS